MSTLKTIRTALAVTAVAAGTFTVATTAGSSDAEARRLVIRLAHVHHIHRHHIFRPRVIVPLIAASYVGGCYWMKARAEALDSPYWWDRYRACRGF